MLAVLIVGFLVSSAQAEPISLNETQMDSITAGGDPRVDAFLCTVNVHGDGLVNARAHNNTDKVAFNDVTGGTDVNGDPVDYVTVAPLGHPNAFSVPVQATNTGSPKDGFSAPGQSGYTAIWAK